MRDYLYIGSTPCEESCAQVGSADYMKQATRECKLFAEQIARHYPEPENGYLSIKANHHDFGTYYEVVAVFNTGDEEATNWAFAVENDDKGVLRTWDKESVEAIIFETT